MTKVQHNKLKPQQLQYFKSVFLVLLNVPIGMVFTETAEVTIFYSTFLAVLLRYVPNFKPSMHYSSKGLK